MTADTAESALYILYRREQRKGARWRKVAQSANRAELVAQMNGAADFLIVPLVTPALAGPPTVAPAARGAAESPEHPATPPERATRAPIASGAVV